MKKTIKQKKKSNGFHKILFVVYALAIVWTSLAYAVEHRVAASTVPWCWIAAAMS